jgi:hypothetical protein
VSGAVGRLSGLSVCEDVCTLASAVGAVGLSGCRRFRVLSGGVGLSGLCRGEQPYFVVLVRLALRFDPDNSKQPVEESNPNMHTLKYMHLKISFLTPRGVLQFDSGLLIN